jgi:hypothetical protein
MKANWLIPAIAFPMAIFLLFIIGCEGNRGPAGPAGEVPVFIEGYVAIPYQEEESSGQVSINVSNCLGLPQAQINGINIPYSFGHPATQMFWTPMFYEEDFDISSGESAYLSINFILSNGETGNAEGNIVMPDSFIISSLEPTLEELLEDSITFIWTESNHANFYFLDFWISYYHSAGDSYNELDTLVSTTYVTYHREQLFPNFNEISGIHDISGTLLVWAVNGPFPGQSGNIEGDGVGTFHGLTGSWLWIQPDNITGTYNKNCKENKIMAMESLERHFEKLSITSTN